MKFPVRKLAAVVCGFAAGLAVGPVSIVAAHASDAWVRGWPWPEFDSKFVVLLLVTSLPGGINGAVGAGLAAALGRRRRIDITWFPVGLHTASAAVAVNESSYLFSVYQLVTLLYAVVVWPAGRMGQAISTAFRRGAR